MQKSKINQIKILGILLLTFLLIQPSEILAQSRSKSKTNYSIKSNGKSEIQISTNGKNFKIEFEGDITISADDKDITAISDGGFIEITKSSFGSKRRILIESDRSGKLIKKYYVGRKEKSYNSEGKAWLAEILPEVVRTTTIAAESRVNRFYAKGGANAVLNEVRQMDSDYVQSAYLKLLLKKSLNSSELVSVIETAGKRINSDHYLAGILKSNQSAFLANDETVDAYINASKSLSSDHYATSVLKKVISDKSITDNQMAKLLDISKTINSDHYLSTVLTQIMDKRDLNSQNVSKIIELSKDISSDHYKTQVLKKVIRENNMPSDAYDAFIATLSDVNSDHYATEVIKDLLDSNLDTSTKSISNLLELVNRNVNSDHYAAIIYKKLAKQDLSEDQLITVLNSARNINSDHYMSNVLLAFADKVNRSSEGVKTAYRNAAKSINSDTYYGRVAKAVD
ncbi:hypothetical protein FBALC1_07818 [Flavobacteriales bacterium ALC-1]|nr:hypothetical protein FBALC1_07818 [Flavobacteriales bacterium ALC-1]